MALAQNGIGDVCGGVLELQSPAQAGFVDSAPGLESRIDEHRECSADQLRKTKFLGMRHSLARVAQRFVEVAGHAFRKCQRDQRPDLYGGIVLGIAEGTLQQRRTFDRTDRRTCGFRPSGSGRFPEQSRRQLADGRFQQGACPVSIAGLEMMLGCPNAA